MLSDRATLQHLIRATRHKYVERDLVCTECASPNVTAKSGHALPYVCAECLGEFAELAELAVRT